ncbi:MerR family transcriptional regulator [Lutibacter sp. TH_r2]|uniref:MerR family transcriptional regulator n=1 Tax=Lutibacter sp. TH_r2 TaxID=3082083 RepID=UPI0029552EEA|nr:MerR family transcriptional regulator [Lutibacter sp. TH_r2]MDV7187286.1 MerR family transcriptional regulator [Lutibacter sp. TH_r2]
MNNIKSEFTIKDLENFSGIKAHTIRIWEKRYNLLEPNRTDSNIRYYNINNLQKLLNVSLLNNNGLKISRIADLPDSQIAVKVRELVAKEGANTQASNSLKLSMLNFDENLFNVTYNNLIAQSSLRDVFKNVFLPFLNEIGLLWQVNSITPAHEHFITNLIKQKIFINIERLQLSSPTNFDKIFVLYLPMNEIHELGLLYLHFELLLHGYQSIYLGQSVPVANLNDIQKVYNSICFITYLTVEPSRISVEDYITNVEEQVLNEGEGELWLLGRKVAESDFKSSNSKIKAFKTIDTLLNNL